MKIIIMLTMLYIATTTPVLASIHSVSSYSRSDGTYVESYSRDTSNDGNSYNNRRSYWGW